VRFGGPALAVLVTLCEPVFGHAPPTPIPAPPLRVRANQLVDSTNSVFLLRGVAMPGLEVFSPAPADLDSQRTMTRFTFRIIQQRWNMNAVRLPVSPEIWKRDGQAYFDRVAGVVSAANQEGLVVILAAQEDARSGTPAPTGLPSPGMTGFWRACAGAFQKSQGVIFALFNEPGTRSITGFSAGTHRAADWQMWRNGGTLAQGQTAAGMQDLVNAIRAAGATQIIAAPSFHDGLGFQGFVPEFYLQDANVLYETYPFYDQGLTDAARNANFGFLAGTFPVYAGAWGMPFGRAVAACSAIPRDVSQANDLLFQTVAYFDLRGISWTVADFAPGSLIQSFDDFPATPLGQSWNCDATGGSPSGIGQFVLLWMTGDPAGFGSLAANQISSAAGGIPGPVAPGQILALYGQLIGPEIAAGAQLDANGRVTTTLAETQVFFDGIPAPMLLAGAFQVNVQASYEVAGRASTVVQLMYRGIPSNKVELPVVNAAPGILTLLGTSVAAALNQDGTVNDLTNPAARGSVISVFATGAGLMKPASVTGAPAQAPLPAPVLPVTLKIANQETELFYAGAAPGFAGVLQVNARVPTNLALEAAVTRASIVLVVGAQESRQGITFWVK
jgi:uncharacterized protein (TIGR03437 family)